MQDLKIDDDIFCKGYIYIYIYQTVSNIFFERNLQGGEVSYQSLRR